MSKKKGQHLIKLCRRNVKMLTKFNIYYSIVLWFFKGNSKW